MKKITFLQAIINFWKGYIEFGGTATRGEFWQAYLFQIIVLLCSIVLSIKLAACVCLLFILPSLTLSCRRFRDAMIPVWVWFATNIFGIVMVWGGYFFNSKLYSLMVANCYMLGECNLISLTFPYGNTLQKCFFILAAISAVINIIVYCLPTGWNKE